MTLRELKVEFASLLQAFVCIQGDLNLFGTPFNVDVGNVPQSLQMELIELQCNELLKNKFNLDDASLIDFYKKYLFPSGKFPNLVPHAKKMASLFGSTYVCEQNKLRTKVTNAHLDDVLLLSSTNLSPNVEVLSCNKQHQTSHLSSYCFRLNGHKSTLLSFGLFLLGYIVHVLAVLYYYHCVILFTEQTQFTCFSGTLSVFDAITRACCSPARLNNINVLVGPHMQKITQPCSRLCLFSKHLTNCL